MEVSAVKNAVVAAAVAVVAVVAVPLARSEQVSMTINEALNAQAALSALDGYDRVVKDERGQEKVVKVPYVLDGKVRIGIAQDLAALRSIAQAFQDARNGKMAEIGRGEGVKPGTPEEAQLNQELVRMLGVKQAIEVVKFTGEELGLLGAASNPIPPTALAGLGPLLLTTPLAAPVVGAAK